MSSELRRRGLKASDSNSSGDSKEEGIRYEKSNKNSLPDEETVKQRLILVLKIFVVIVLFVVSGTLYFLITRLGYGHVFPTQEIKTQKPLLSSTKIQIAATLPYPPGNIAVSSDGTIYFNFHPEYNPNPVKVAKIVSQEVHDLAPMKSPKGDSFRGIEYSYYQPFPNIEFQMKLITCLSMRIDRQDRLWLLDFGQHGFKGYAKFFAFHLSTESKGEPSLYLNYTFPSEIAGMGSMLNDFQVDPIGKYIYIVDTSIVALTPALVVFDIESKTSYRLLSAHKTLFGESILFDIDEVPMSIGPFGFKIGVDSVALSRTGDNLYFGAVTSTKLYTLPTSTILLLIQSMKEKGKIVATAEENKALETAIVVASDEKPITDGLSSDNNGNIWLTAPELSSVVVMIPNHDGTSYSVKKIVESIDMLRWPDGFSFGPDGLYVTCSALHLKFGSGDSKEKAIRKNKGPDRKGGKHSMSWNQLHGPFHILRLSKDSIQSIVGEELPVSGH